MNNKNLFTEEELKEMGKRTLDLLLSSIEKNDKEAAKKLSRRMYNEFLGMHDLYRDWITDLLSFIGRRFGDGVLYEVLKKTVEGYTRNLSKFYSKKTVKQKLKILWDRNMTKSMTIWHLLECKIIKHLDLKYINLMAGKFLVSKDNNN